MESIDWVEIENKLDKLFDLLKEIKTEEEDFDFFPYMLRTGNNMFDLTEFLEDTLPIIKDRKKMSILLMVTIFCIIEGVISYLVNFIIYGLIRQGHHDIWDEIKQNFVTSYDEISYLPLSVKLKFLENHDFGFVNILAHRELRNAYAHQNYTIDEDGNVLIYKRQKIVDKLSMENLVIIINDIQKLLETVIKIYASKIDVSFDELMKIFTEMSREEFESLAKKIFE